MVCGKCNLEFKAGRMGVIVKTLRTVKMARGRRVVGEQVVSFRHGDEFICPGCGAVVITSMGLAYEGETRPPDYTVQV